MPLPRWVLVGSRLMAAEKAALNWGPWRTFRGDGLFETVGCEDGAPFLWEEHRQRLASSARALWGRPPSLPQEHHLRRLLLAAGLASGPAVLRVVWYPPLPQALTWAEPVKVPRRQRREGVELELVCVSSHPLSQHKLTSYGPVLWLGRQWAPCGIVLVDGEGFLREAATANIFFLFGQKVVTPPEGRILPGTVRRWCLGRLAQLGVEVAEEEVHLEQLAAATGAFLTASVSGLLPVRRLGPHRFPLPSWVVELLTSQGFPAPGYRQRRQRRTGKPPRLEP